MAADTVEVDLAAELARDLVSKAAPHELPLFEATSEEFRRNPERALAGDESKDEMLGFGVDMALAMLTPVALVVAKDVVTFVTAEVSRVAKEESRPVIAQRVRALFPTSTSSGRPSCWSGSPCSPAGSSLQRRSGSARRARGTVGSSTSRRSLSPPS